MLLYQRRNFLPYKISEEDKTYYEDEVDKAANLAALCNVHGPSSKYCEEITGYNYDDWLSQWIYRGAYPKLELTFSWDAGAKIATVGIKQTQKGDKKNEELLFKIAFPLVFYYKRGEERFSLEIKTFLNHLKLEKIL